MKSAFITVGLALAGVLTVAPAVAAQTKTLPIKCTATLTNHPENSSPAWAMDNFTRTTVFRHADKRGNIWTATMKDRGHFITTPNAKSDSGDTIKTEVTGRFTGQGIFTVTSDAAPKCTDPKVYDGSAPPTSTWVDHYFTGEFSDSGITEWDWVYQTCRERMVETPTGVTGHMSGLPCHHKSPSPTPSPTKSDTPTPSPTPTTQPTTPGQAPAPSPVKTDLPVTG